MKLETKPKSWMEVMHLQSDERSIKELLSVLPGLIEEMTCPEHLVDIQLMTNPQIVSSLVLSLFWSNQKKQTYTKEGMFLADYLSSWGVVYHMYWNIACSVKGQKSETNADLEPSQA